MKSIYRCTFKFTGVGLKHIPTRNIFLRSADVESGEKLARETFRLKMIAHRIPEDAPYDFTISPSTDVEVIIFAQQERVGANTARLSN